MFMVLVRKSYGFGGPKKLCFPTDKKKKSSDESQGKTWNIFAYDKFLQKSTITKWNLGSILPLMYVIIYEIWVPSNQFKVLICRKSQYFVESPWYFLTKIKFLIFLKLWKIIIEKCDTFWPQPRLLSEA